MFRILTHMCMEPSEALVKRFEVMFLRLFLHLIVCKFQMSSNMQLLPFSHLYLFFVVFCFDGAGDQTQDSVQARQILYH
jgi:hypothetical protein